MVLGQALGTVMSHALGKSIHWPPRTAMGHVFGIAKGEPLSMVKGQGLGTVLG